MMSRIAALIHKQDPQQQRRITPGVTLAAATIVAVVLFLAASGVSRADTNANPCAGLSAVVLTASEASSVNAERSTPEAECRYSVTVMPPPVEQPADPAGTVQSSCVVTTSPVLAPGAGVHLETEAVGQCDGVQILIDISVSADRGDVQASSSGTKSAKAELKGLDLPGATMFSHYAWLKWRYTTTPVTPLDDDDGTQDNIWWGLVSESSGKGAKAGTDFYFRWHSAVWHSDGFPLPIGPDLGAKTKATVFGGAGGSYHCNFSHYWTYGSSNYIGKRFSTSCTTP